MVTEKMYMILILCGAPLRHGGDVILPGAWEKHTSRNLTAEGESRCLVPLLGNGRTRIWTQAVRLRESASSATLLVLPLGAGTILTPETLKRIF